MLNKNEYKRQFDKDNYTHMNLTLPKEYKELIEKAAQTEGKSKNAFVKEAIDEKIRQLHIGC